MKFENQSFKEIEVTLDYNEFIDCDFRNCTIVFRGGRFSLHRARFVDVTFGLDDAAERTFDFMRLLRSAPNGKQLVDELLDAAAPLNGSVTVMR